MSIILTACSPLAEKVTVNDVPHDGYGYTIRFNGKDIIRQQNIPAINSNKPFLTRKEAKRIGKLALSKLQRNPRELPDITIRDLDSLKISY